MKIKSTIFFVILSGLLLAFLYSCKKEGVKIVGDLEGIVRNEFGQPIEGALIKAETFSTTSDIMGEYSMRELPAKEYSVSVSKDFFLTKVQKKNIIENKLYSLDFALTAGKVYLNLSDSVLNFEENQGTYDIKITSNAGWVISNSASWLVCDAQSGGGNSHVGIRYSSNQGDSKRKDTIRFISGSIKKLLIISQSAPVKIVKCEGIIGNRGTNIKDSVYILFNRPVNVNNFVHIRSDNGYGIRFSISGVKLGGDYTWSIAGTDDEGKNFNISAKIPFYQSKLKLEGIITDYLLVNHDKEILISAYLPCRIIRYSIESASIIQTYDFSKYISPIKMSYNPYNSKIYIMGCSTSVDWHGAGVNLPDIYTLDLQTSEIKKAITIIPDNEDHPQNPAIIPFNLGFTKTGFGVVLLKANGSSALRWKIIDCANKDSLYNYPYYDDVNFNKYTIFFDRVYRNYDDSKLCLMQPYGSSVYGIFDVTTKRVSLLPPSLTERPAFIIPFRKSDKFFDELNIFDLAGNVIKVSYSGGCGSADFDYRENEENVLYIIDNESFRYVDYNIGITSMWCDILSGLSTNKFTTTLDGKYALAYNYNTDNTSNMYVFNTESFSRYIK